MDNTTAILIATMALQAFVNGIIAHCLSMLNERCRGFREELYQRSFDSAAIWQRIRKIHGEVLELKNQKNV